MRRENSSRRRTADLDWFDSGWVGADPGDDLDARLAADAEPFDEATPHVLTALGPVDPGAVGMTLVGGWDRPLVTAGNPAAALHELEHLYAAGLRSLVDLGSSATADGTADLAWVSGRSPVHIIVGRDMMAERTESAASIPRFGVMKIGTRDELEQIPRMARNVPLFVHESAVRPGMDMDLLRRAAIDPARLTVVGDATAPGVAWEPVLATGVRLALIIHAAGRAEMESSIAGTIRDLVARGHRDRLLLGYQDDPVSLLERLPIALMEAGLTAMDVRELLVDNPAQTLTLEPGRRSTTAIG